MIFVLSGESGIVHQASGNRTQQTESFPLLTVRIPLHLHVHVLVHFSTSTDTLDTNSPSPSLALA